MKTLKEIKEDLEGKIEFCILSPDKINFAKKIVGEYFDKIQEEAKKRIEELNNKFKETNDLNMLGEYTAIKDWIIWFFNLDG